MMDKATQKIWDVIIIGTGMGGGPLGRVLAEAGLSVLFLEKGPMGAPAEEHRLDSEVFDPVARLVRGFWPKPMKATIDGRMTEFFTRLHWKGLNVGTSRLQAICLIPRGAGRFHMTNTAPISRQLNECFTFTVKRIRFIMTGHLA